MSSDDALSSPFASPVTPCIGVCTIDPDTEVCQGCLRTLEEIAGWGEMTQRERLAIMRELPGRADGGDAST